MKKKILSGLFVLIFLALIGVIDYPFVSRIINEIDQTNVTRDYEHVIDELSEEEKQRYLAEAVSYNKKLVENAAVSLSLPFEDTESEDEEYHSLLNMHQDGVMASVEIPKIEARLPVYHGTAEAVLQKGAGHLEGSSLPVGGESSHTILSAHRGLPTKRLFTDLDQIEEEDIFLIRIFDRVMAYQVHEVVVVTPDEVAPLKIIAGEDLATLITCTPYGINTHRIYVHGHRVPYEEAMEVMNELDNNRGFWAKYWWVVLTAVLLVWMVFLLYWFNRKPKT